MQHWLVHHERRQKSTRLVEIWVILFSNYAKNVSIWASFFIKKKKLFSGTFARRWSKRKKFSRQIIFICLGLICASAVLVIHQLGMHFFLFSLSPSFFSSKMMQNHICNCYFHILRAFKPKLLRTEDDECQTNEREKERKGRRSKRDNNYKNTTAQRNIMW